MGSWEDITLYGCAVNCFSHLASQAQGFCQFPVATDAICYPTGCVGVSAGPSGHPLCLQTLYPTCAEGPGADARLKYKWTTLHQKAWKGTGNRDVTIYSCLVLPAPKSHLGYHKIIEAELKSWKPCVEGEDSSMWLCREWGRGCRKRSSRKQAGIQGKHSV